MSSIIVASIPVHGHITPMLAVAENFVTRGDDVRFVTGSHFADKVAATGATFVPLPAEADFDVEQFLQRFPERAKLKGLKAGTFDLENLLARPAKAQYETLMAALVAQSADAVLAEPLFLGAALLLEHQRPKRPAVVKCSVVPLPIDSRDTAPFGLGLPPARLFNRQRNAALAGFRNRTYRVMVATDVAARGLDIPDVSHVINYDLPDESENYIHRIGRTARMGKSGEALSLVTPEEDRKSVV